MDVNAAEEEDAEFFCRAEGIPAPRVSMFINGVPIENVNNPRLQVGQDKIIFKNLTKSDTLVVQCNATNKFQDGYVYGDAYLNVLAEEPSFLRPPPLIQEVPADKSTIIPCQVFGAPKPRISWTRNGVDVSGGAKYTIHPSGDLEIKNVQSSDGGEYACHASNKFGSGFRDGRLVVRAPTTLLTVPQDQMVELGSNVKFVCTARTDPEKMSKLEMYWLKDSERINLNQAQRLYENYMDNSLIISDVNLLDSGKYTCVAKNGLENDQSNHTATLVVQGRPEPPKVVTIMECGTQQARVSWSAGSDNYAQILKYRIEYNTTFTPATWVEIRTVSAANSQQYLPLSPYVNYTFRVLAQNRIGWSLPSTHSKQVCTTPPAAPSHNPENVETWNTEWDQLHIRWTPMAPVEHNGQGFHYLITYYRLDIPNDIIKSVRIDDWTQRELRIENTPFYTPYAIKVQAINSMSAAPDEPAIVGFSGESTPLVAPTNFMLNPNVAVTSNKASFIWDAVDPESDQIRGFMRGYQIQFWLEEEGEQGMRTEYIYTRDLALEGRNWVDKIRTKRQTPPKMEATISNLPSSQRIVAQVRVINKKYAGPPSNKIIVQTPEGVPGPVQNFQFVLVGPNHIKLQWNKPAEPNGKITGYDIGYRTVTGLSLGAIQYKEPAMTIGPDDTRDRFTATITGMKSSTRYRVYVWARTNVGRGEQDFLDAATLEPSSPGKPDFRAVAGPCSSVVDCPINVTFIPASVNPGGAFYVQYRKKGTNMWMNTFTETDRMWRNISKLDPGTTYEVRLVAMNSKQYSTASDVKGIDTLGSAMSIGYIGTAGWFYGMIIAILALILILIVVCVLRRKRGENYPVHEKEQLRGPEFEQHEGGFGEYQRGYDNAYYQRATTSYVTQPLMRYGSIYITPPQPLLVASGPNSNF
ncbi:neuroglian-like isoform X1 [Lingula anatina]|uniref:Neuroglian-like isoform X1 n=1 Tax=Lingula anatina TaxID=7574 RepID=A0A2R2MK98_LINAN|nr:neuroglian-like isoform X1 [Lingula anatina]|eukprot:XP_023930628.1 neuroglian-like isoform X1 [Lingula anatina]